MLDSTLKHARILLVDDQPPNLALLENLLTREGYSNLKSVDDPRQFFAAFEEFQPDIILLDLHMPHLDGFAILEGLRARIPADDYLPILVLTADATTEAKLRALGMGARDFLAKPLDLAETSLRVKNLLETRFLYQWQKNENQILEEKVRERTEELARRLRNIEALRRIDQMIAGSLNLKLTLGVVLEHTRSELNVDAADILLYYPHSLTLEYSAGIGFRGKGIEHSRLRPGEGLAGRALMERKTIRVADLREENLQFSRADLLAEENFISYFCAPLIAKGQVKGVLEVFHRAALAPGRDWLELLELLAGQAAIAVDSIALFNDLQRSNIELRNAYDATIEGWSYALDLRDKETEGHTQRVTELTMKLARAAGMSEEELIHVQRGALLHDIGKMGVPDQILLKPDKLTDEEWVAMRKHPVFAYEMLSRIAYLKPALSIPYCHHEKWDGTGYPRGLKGEQIPLAARLFAVVDVWDALRSDRPYRQGWPREKTLEHIQSLSGTHFDPKAVELFFKVIAENQI